jgi:hypothetical protein
VIEPPLPQDAADQRATLVAFLDHYRAVFAVKTDGLTEEQCRRPVVTSGWSLASMVKHLIDNERYWFAHLWAGLPDVPLDPDEWVLGPADTTASLLATYRAVCAESNALILAAPDLSVPSAHTDENMGRGPQLFTLHWALVHMLEETARHAGHADIAREILDGGGILPAQS